MQRIILKWYTNSLYWVNFHNYFLQDMIEVPIKYAFPLFTKHNSTDYLIKHTQIRVSDIWAFWYYIIGRYVKKYSGEKDFLLTLIEQAKYFYEAAEKAPIKSQPLLYYYSFLNLVKVVINVNTLPAFGTTKEYYHGIESCKIHKGDLLKNHYVEILGYIGSTTKISVAYQFMKQMGDIMTIPPKYRIDIISMMESCIGIHRTYCETNNCKETYFKISDLKLFKEGKKLYSKYLIPHCTTQIQTDLVTAGYHIISEIDKEGNTKFYWQEDQLMTNYAPTKFDYYMLSQKLKEKGFWYFTDGEKYKTYISTNPIHISTESIIYCLMFFFGSITRYHPYMFDSLLTEQQMWLISEFLKTQPKQFLNAVTSRTIESFVLKPKTANLIN